MNDCLNYFVKVKKEDAGFYTSFFDAFQGMLSLRTPKPPKDNYCVFHFIVSPDYKNEFENVINNQGLEFIEGT